MDLSCDYNYRLLKQVPWWQLTIGNSWLLSGKQEEVLKAVNEVETGLTTDLVLLLPDHSLLELYRPHLQSKLNARNCSLADSPPCPPVKSRFDLRGAYLRGGVVNFLNVPDNEEGRQYFDSVAQNKFAEIHRPEFLIRKYYQTNLVLEQLFNYRTKLVLTNSFGYQLPNGSFDGLVRLLSLNEADMGVSPLSIMTTRLDYIHYSAPVEPLQINLVFLEERSLGGVMALATPFSGEVWVWTVAVSAVSVLVSAAIFYIYFPKNVISEGALNVIGLVSAQKIEEMNVTSCRILNLFLLNLGLILAIFYNAAIMNALLSPTPVNIKNIKDLLDEYSVGVANITYMKPVYFHPLLIKRLSQYKQAPIYSTHDGVREITRRNFALVGDGKVLYEEMDEALTDSQKCNARDMNMVTFYLSIGHRKNSHYQEMFKQGFTRLIENGIGSRERKYWFHDPPHCLGGTVFEPVGLKAMAIAIVIFVFGLLFSIILFIFELRFKEKNEFKISTKNGPRPYLN